MASSSRRPGGGFQFSTSTAGVPESKASLLVATKIDNLQQSCERVRLTGQEALPWSGLLDDFLALSASLRLLRDSVPSNFNALAVTPHEVPLNLERIGLIPDLLSTYPGDDAYEIEKELLDTLKKRGLLAEAGLLVSQDGQQLRCKVQTFNKKLEQAREVLQQAAAEAKLAVSAEVRSTATTQPLRPKQAIIRKDFGKQKMS